MILYAININSGGGLILLQSVVKEEYLGKVETLFIDERCPTDELSKFVGKIHQIKPTLFSRLLAELKLKKVCKDGLEKVVCFGNLPPLFRLKSHVAVFLQNAYLLKSISYPQNLKQRCRYIYERTIFYHFIKNVDEIWVQTQWMKDNLKSISDKPVLIKKILPVLPRKRRPSARPAYNILAVTGIEEHKNLNLLMSSLELLKREVSVCIVANADVKIKNPLVNLTHFNSPTREKVYDIYNASGSLIMLSEFESFGLPLYEAKHFGLKILAPLKGYICKEIYPDYVIKDLSTDSVCEAIEMYMEEESI